MQVKGLLVDISEDEWTRIRNELIARHGPGIMITWVCRRELGFSCRHKQYEHGMFLDFVDEPSVTAFLLRWS